MPLCKCKEVEIRPWKNAGEDRMAFRCTYAEINPSRIDMLTGAYRDRYITLFGKNSEAEVAFKTELIDTNKVPNLFVMSYACKVLPYCRIYTQATKNHNVGDYIIDETTGKPRIYDTIIVDCESIIVDGKEVPKNMSQVERNAANQRAWYMNNDDKNGLRRYVSVEEAIGEIPLENENIDPTQDDAHDLPPEVIAPGNGPQKPRFDPNTGQPLT